VKPNRLVLELDETRRFSLELEEKALQKNFKLTPVKVFQIFMEVR
jgi:hypothetical protein